MIVGESLLGLWRDLRLLAVEPKEFGNLSTACKLDLDTPFLVFAGVIHK